MTTENLLMLFGVGLHLIGTHEHGAEGHVP
jgi:hypothetical protein